MSTFSKDQYGNSPNPALERIAEKAGSRSAFCYAYMK